ncbi:MAG: hypothetical protein EAZ85_07880 [Bacteroidetes bacterium]|nr:MAG: hypothetical protein EAZ85_07880 [Bacteroidota bacterium]TAG85546.1 MAG: hypothetical protein EAZ20_14820 [Bacteroidota bacterium]
MKKHQLYNSFTQKNEIEANFIKRFYIYQKERFPLLAYIILIGTFSFSAIAYSCICRNVNFVDIPTYLMGFFMAISLFLLLRIADEHKDFKDDIRFRQNLPVPRGVISLKELSNIAWILISLQILLQIAFYPKMLYLYTFVMLYMFLMFKEFFVADWLKKHQFYYAITHIAIVPIVDIYVSGFDWFLAGANISKGLWFFFVVSYCNSVVLEIGRKIRVPQQESEGVQTYTSMLGTNNAAIFWLFILSFTFLSALFASFYANLSFISVLILTIVFIICSIPAILFLYKKSIFLSKLIEISSLFWTIMMYLILGAGQIII